MPACFLFITKLLLCNLRADELAHQSIELRRLLILGLLAAMVQGLSIDAWVDLFEGSARLRRSGDSFAAPDSHYRHLQTGQRLARVHGQIAAEGGRRRVTRIGLVSAAEDIFHQLIGNQAGVVVALAIVVALDAATRRAPRTGDREGVERRAGLKSPCRRRPRPFASPSVGPDQIGFFESKCHDQFLTQLQLCSAWLQLRYGYDPNARCPRLVA